MIDKFIQFNESRRSKKRRFHGIERNYNRYNRSLEESSPENGMKLDVSPRFKAVVEKMVGIGGLIAKNLLEEINKKERLFKISYIDISRNLDMLTYLPLSEKNSGTDPYKNPKRIGSKIYKVIRMLFENSVTKEEIQKFVSVFKKVCSSDPERPSPKPKTEVSGVKEDKKTNNEIIFKLIEDTIENKIKWETVQNTDNLESYRTIVNITNNKKLEIDVFIMKKNIDLSSLSIFYIINKNNNFIKSIKFSEIKEFEDLIELIR